MQKELGDVKVGSLVRWELVIKIHCVNEELRYNLSLFRGVAQPG